MGFARMDTCTALLLFAMTVYVHSKTVQSSSEVCTALCRVGRQAAVNRRGATARVCQHASAVRGAGLRWMRAWRECCEGDLGWGGAAV